MIIADRWILTAAHVLTSSNGPVSPNNVRVSDLLHHIWSYFSCDGITHFLP